MIDTLQAIERRYEDLNRQMSDSEVISDRNRLQELAKEHSSLTPIIEVYTILKKTDRDLEQAYQLVRDSSLDSEMKELAQVEIGELEYRREELLAKLKILLLPSDPNDDKDVILEVRAGTGGEEAALFAGDLLRMYIRFAERRNWSAELLSATTASAGGYKEAVISIRGKGAFSQLKYESGVHRVQRVPSTESSGRIHTSAATVAVLPEVEDVDVEIDPQDLEIDTYRASSAGGQHVNKTESAIRITHKPTGIVVTCQDERSQTQNREKALRMLRAHLYELKQQEQDAAVASQRKSQVGSGDRSEKIRTYNFPQGRVTDHRIGLTIYSIDQFLDGDIQQMIDALINHNHTERLNSAA